ncbi:uncharacterized protein LOC114648069 [Erpetoichthys calabaricus]|uniref:uncharacterized protein LOC114648069 n=1 Tax=Erpetoichthys calabaricus TaxID=27687 RepID=UPI0010A0829C|nr:uncharacterized protein LOC114648069 [Erpetoichthys calabaricus]
MGSGSSRGRKVSAALEKDANTLHKGVKQGELEGDSRLYKIQKLSRFCQPRARAAPDCHSEGNESDFSLDEEDADGEHTERKLDRALAELEGNDFSSKRKHHQGSFVRSNTYSFCSSRQVYPGPDFSSTPYIQTGVPRKGLANIAPSYFGREGVNACAAPATPAWGHHLESHRNSQSEDFDVLKEEASRQNGSLAPLTPQDLENNNVSDKHTETFSPTGASVFYDGSEEELMASIEREYS